MRRVLWSFCISLPLVSAALAQKVVTVAGGFLGNNTPALSASFGRPTAVAFDAVGNMYVADSENCLIRKINKEGTVSNFAGTGICGFNGDGAKAWRTMLSQVRGLALDLHGDLFFADQGNQRIRKIDVSGTVSTVAGNGISGYSGDGGLATSASLSFPEELDVDPAGNLYIADFSNYVVRLVDTAGIIHTIAGNHTNGYSGDGGAATAAQMGNPQAVAADENGNVYIGETSQHVRKVDSNGIITTIAGNGQNGNAGDGGPATSAAVGFVEGLLFHSGLLYISNASSIWSLDLGSGLIHLIANTSVGAQGFAGDGGLATSALFNFPVGMRVDSSNNLFVADSENNRIREISSATQIVSTVAGGYIGDGSQARHASLDLLTQGSHISFDNNGNLYIADGAGARVRKVSPNGIITTVAGTGTTGYSGDGGPATSAQLSSPGAVGVDSVGNIFIADFASGIRKVDTSGTISTLHPNGAPFSPFLFEPGAGLAVDSSGDIFVSDGLTVVWKIDPSNNASIVAGTYFGFGFGGDDGPATQALLFLPAGIAVDASGNLYIADWLNNRIRKVDPFGVITTVAGNGLQGFSGDGGPATAASLSLPTDVAVDPAGNLYIADWINFRIRVVDPSGTIQTLVGASTFGYNGDHTPANQTSVFPGGLTVSPTGQLYFSDMTSGRVRKVIK